MFAYANGINDTIEAQNYWAHNLYIHKSMM